jgi:hypothetical protein
MGYSLPRARTPDFPPHETALHEATASYLAPTPHPTPWGGSPHPQTHIGSRGFLPNPKKRAYMPAYMALGMGGQNGWPAVVGPIPETALHEATTSYLTPTPQPTPWGGPPTPDAQWLEGVFAYPPKMGRYGLGDGWSKCIASKKVIVATQWATSALGRAG